MPGFPALSTTARARLSEKPALLRSRHRVQACSGAGCGSQGTCLDGLWGSPVHHLLECSPNSRSGACCWGMLPAPALRGALHGPRWVRGVVSPAGLGGFSPLSDWLRLFKEETDRLWVVSFLWEFLSE